MILLMNSFIFNAIYMTLMMAKNDFTDIHVLKLHKAIDSARNYE